MLNAFQVNIAGTKTITVNIGEIYHAEITFIGVNKFMFKFMFMIGLIIYANNLNISFCVICSISTHSLLV